ncbi:MAG: hypothetical protein PHH23_06655 [Paludibacteraceae bacterium]|nr:hypothetical protein [Paludibacteraceae bacterium]
MKKLLLNDTIKGLNDETVSTQTGRYVTEETGARVAEITPVKFGSLALAKILRSRTGTDAEATALFDLGQRINENLALATPTQIEVSDEEFATIKGAIDSEAVVVKARFIEMVESLNA